MGNISTPREQEGLNITIVGWLQEEYDQGTLISLWSVCAFFLKTLMTNPSPENTSKQHKDERTLHLEKQRQHAMMPPDHFTRGFIAKVFQSGKQMIRVGVLGGTLFLGHTVYEEVADQTSIAIAQDATPTLTDEQRAEMRRLHEEGTAAYDREDFENALRMFLRLEEIGREAGIPPDIIMSWNICLVELRLAGFEFVNSRIRASIARPVNERNRRRLEEVLGFTTVAQIQPVRNSLLDAQTRLFAIRDAYDRLLASGTTSARQDLEDTRAALTFIESTLQRIETRYTELQASTVTSAPIDPIPPIPEPDPAPALPPSSPSSPLPSSSSSSPSSPSAHTERPWPLGLSVAGGGVALMGASLVTYFATSPTSANEDQVITGVSNGLFWVGAAAALTGAGIIAFGEYEVEETTITPTVAPRAGGATIGVSGRF